MPSKSNKKKKSHTGLIISIIAGSILLLTAIILLITRPWNNNSNIASSNNDSTTRSKNNSKNGDGNIVIDQEFVNNVKDHKYKPLTNTRDFSLFNTVNYLETKEGGSYNMQIPSEWTDDTDSEYSGRYWAKDKVGYFVFETDFAFDVVHENVEVDPSDFYTPEVAMDKYIESYGPLGPYEVLDQFTKEINGQEYQVALAKITDLDGDFIYKVIYLRLLDKGSLVPSYLVASISISELDKEADKETLLNDIYDLENTLGGFDESDQ